MSNSTLRQAMSAPTSFTYIAVHEAAPGSRVKRTTTTFPTSYPRALAESILLMAVRQTGVKGEVTITRELTPDA